jgi:hypothetical protein
MRRLGGILIMATGAGLLTYGAVWYMAYGPFYAGWVQ